MAMPKFPKLPNDPTGITPEQVDLFLTVFRGRRDVVAELWKSEKSGKTGYQPICFNEWKDDLCRKPCRICPNAKYRQLDDPLIRQHLAGITILGNYPLLEDNTCWFVAGDFDNHDGARDPLTDIRNFHETCAVNDITAYVFASKSGKGYHVYWFFSKPIEAWKARALYHAMLIEAGILDDDHQLDNSFDRIFPNQDHLSGKGLGNLIAFPFLDIQHNSGKSLMLDPETAFENPFADQWAQLRYITRIEESFVDSLVTAWKLKPSKPMRKTVSTSPKSTTGRKPAAGAAGAGAAGDPEMESLIDRALSGDIKKGERDETIFKIACRLRGKGLSKREAEFFCCSLVDRCCEQASDDPYTHADAVAKVDSAWRYEPNEDAEDEDTGADPSLPTICAQKYQLPTVVRQAWEALIAKNDPPILFRNSTGIVDIKYDNEIYDSRPRPRTLNTSSIRLYLSMAANWDKVVKKVTLPDRPPLDVCESLLVDQENPLPYLGRIMTAPYFDQDGMLHNTPGYSPRSKCLLISNLDLGEIPTRPTASDVEQAMAVINDILHDFPFAGPSEKAHAIALMLLPYARQLISGPTPIHLIEAPAPRTGKGLLASAALLPFLGDIPATTTETINPEEMRKNLTSQLITSPSYIFFDNVNHPVRGGGLAEAITSRMWSDRLLGGNKQVEVPVNCVWLMTGNNAQGSGELVNRMVRILLDAKIARPGSRRTNDFRYRDLLGHIKANRLKIVKSCILIIQNWIAKGRPSPADDTPPLGGFEEWADVIGGILAVNGIPGFLGNLKELHESCDYETGADERFVSAWWERYSDTGIGVKELYEINMAMDEPMIDEAASDRSGRTKLGIYLRKLRNRIFEIQECNSKGSVTVKATFGGITHQAALWRLELLKITIGEPK